MKLVTSSATNSKIAVFGEWNTTNLGDRAIFEGVTDFCQNLGWLVDGYGLGSLTPVDSLYTSKFSQNNEENSFTSKLTSIPNTASQGSWKRPLRSLRQQFRIRKLMPQLGQTQAILVGGGALLSDWNLHFPQSLFAITWAAKRLSLPIFCLGCSAEGNWSSQGEKIIQDFVQSCYFVATRDQETASRISELLRTPVEVFGDFALTLGTQNDPPLCKSHISRAQIIGVNVMCLSENWRSYQQQYEDRLVEFINTYATQSTRQIRVFTTGTPEDIVPARRVFDRLMLQEKHLCIPDNLEELHQIIQTNHIVIASRLHAAILSISDRIPVIGFTPGSKIKRFFNSIGLNNFNIDILEPQSISEALALIKKPQLYQQCENLDLSQIDETRNKVRALLI